MNREGERRQTAKREKVTGELKVQVSLARVSVGDEFQNTHTHTHMQAVPSATRKRHPCAQRAKRLNES